MERIKTKVLEMYGSKGDFLPGSWKEDSDKMFGPKQAVEVWKLLTVAGFVPPQAADLVFVSPTANLPTHEEAIWQACKGRSGFTLFLAGDLLPLAPRQYLQQANQSATSTHHFHYLNWDAETLPLRANSADVIWDRKGWVWHSAYHIKNRCRLIQTFAGYYGLLKEGGCIVLDNNDQYYAYLDSLSQFEKLEILIKIYLAGSKPNEKPRPSEIYPGNPNGQYEESTVDAVNSLDRGIWTVLQNPFYIQDIGSGVLKNRVLVKR